VGENIEKVFSNFREKMINYTSAKLKTCLLKNMFKNEKAGNRKYFKYIFCNKIFIYRKYAKCW
jgi:hypothetical protein